MPPDLLQDPLRKHFFPFRRPLGEYNGYPVLPGQIDAVYLVVFIIGPFEHPHIKIDKRLVRSGALNSIVPRVINLPGKRKHSVVAF